MTPTPPPNTRTTPPGRIRWQVACGLNLAVNLWISIVALPAVWPAAIQGDIGSMLIAGIVGGCLALAGIAWWMISEAFAPGVRPFASPQSSDERDEPSPLPTQSGPLPEQRMAEATSTALMALFLTGLLVIGTWLGMMLWATAMV